MPIGLNHIRMHAWTSIATLSPHRQAGRFRIDLVAVVNRFRDKAIGLSTLLQHRYTADTEREILNYSTYNGTCEVKKLPIPSLSPYLSV